MGSVLGVDLERGRQYRAFGGDRGGVAGGDGVAPTLCVGVAAVRGLRERQGRAADSERLAEDVVGEAGSASAGDSEASDLTGDCD